jgi:hypothetical protein
MFQGLSAPRVQLERLERCKQHRAAAQTKAALPRLARLIDYLSVGIGIEALHSGLADLLGLLRTSAVVQCRVAFNEDGGFQLDPVEASVGLAITKQARAIEQISLT